MPVGYVLTIALVAWCTLCALLPIRKGRRVGLMSWFFGFLINELPFVAFFWLAASTLLAAIQGDLASPIGLTAFSLAILTTGGLAVIVWRALQTRPAVEQALAMALGAGWRSGIDAGMVGRLRRGLPLSRIIFGPFFVRRRDVRRVANIPYGDAGNGICSTFTISLARLRAASSSSICIVGGSAAAGRIARPARSCTVSPARAGCVSVRTTA